MDSAGHQSTVSESMSQAQSSQLPTDRKKPDTNPSTVGATTTDNQEDQPWRPTINRQQSWNTQDQKHELQKRLLDLERGKEPGYTETAHTTAT